MKFKSMILVALSVLLLCFFALPVLADEIGPSTPGYTDGHKLGQEDKKGGLQKRTDEQLDTYIKNVYPDFLKDQKWVGAFKAGYAAGYGKEENPEDNKAKIWDSGGKELGELYGKMAAIEDYMDGRRMNWERAVPSERSLYHDFQLDRIGSVERRAFVESFVKAFQDAYEKAYAQAMADNNNAMVKTGAENGKEAGTLYGTIMGRTDYYNGRSFESKAYALMDSEILAHFRAGNTNRDYERSFLAAFRDAYQKAYEAAYRAALMEEGTTKIQKGFENGQEAGARLGQRDATADVLKGLSYNPERSKLTRDQIFSEYNLSLQNSAYAEDFVAGFLGAYLKNYDDTYKSMTSETASGKSVSQVIPLEGLQATSGDQRMGVEIPGGIYYDKAMLSIDMLPSGYIKNFGYIEASRPYRVSVLNPNGNFDDSTKVKIAFQYYGKPKKQLGEGEDGFGGNTTNAGIYKLEGSRWMYLDTKITEGMLVAEVNPQTITGEGNVFAVIVDRGYMYLHDVRGHWAKDEINAMVRRSVISGYPDKTYRPEQPITRAEFLTLLFRHYGWQMTGYEYGMKQFTDASSFGFFEPYIRFGSARGYIVGYPDGQFKPNKSISYREINWIMQRVTGNPNFTWQDYAKLMVNKKGVRSKSLTNLDTSITRAEFAFLMYTMDTWKY